MQTQARTRSLLRIAAITLSFLAVSANATAAGVSTQFSVSGAVTTPALYNYATLAALTPLTQSDSFQSGSPPTTQSHNYQGASLWGILNSAGIITTSAKNDVLNRYVLATGSDGYKVVYSLGELNPSFGNEAVLVAYAENTGSGYAPLTTDGFARTTAPTDIKGGRYVSNLVNLDVEASASTAASTGGGPSTSFAVSGDVVQAMSFDLTALQAMPATTITVGGNTYTGVSFWDLLNTSVGISTNASIKNDLLDMYVVATGTDGYKSVFSMGELSSAFGNQPDLIAYQMNGVDLTSSGFARLVVPNDVKQGRWVSNLASIEVYHAEAPVPEPEVYGQLLVGLGFLALRGLRYRRDKNTG